MPTTLTVRNGIEVPAHPTAVSRRNISIVVQSAVSDARRDFANGLTTCGTPADLRREASVLDDPELWEWIVRNNEAQTVTPDLVIRAMVPTGDEASASQLTDVYHDAYIDTAWDLLHVVVYRDSRRWGIDAGRRW